MRYPKICIIVIFTSMSAYAQVDDLMQIDSLNLNKILGLLEKAESFYKTELDSALYHINNASLAVEPYYAPDLSAKILLHKSKYLTYRREYGSIINTLQPNLDNASEISLESLGRTYKDIGHAYKQEWIADSALVYYIKALKAFEVTQNNRDISLTYLALGLVYSKLDNKPLSKSFYDKSIKYSTNTEIMKLHKDQLIDMDEPITNNQSLGFLLDIAKIAEDRKDYRLLVITYSDIKKDFFRLKNYTKALAYAKKELGLREKMKFNSLSPNTYNFIGNIYNMQQQPKKALEYFELALPDANDSLRLSVFENIKKAYLQMSQPNNAIMYMDKYVALKDSINDKNISASIAEITAKYQDEKQKQDIKTLSFQNKANEKKIANQSLTLLSIIGSTISLFILAFLVYKNYKTKQDLVYTQLNSKLLQTQLNPHFIFNALNEIKLNLNEKNTKQSSENLASYSKLMRLILEGSTQDFVSFSDDIALVSSYLKLQQLVHNSSFEYDLTIEDTLEANYLILPPMLTQPFVENAVLHGTKGVKNPKINVVYKIISDSAIIEISDNGKGLLKNTNQSTKYLYASHSSSITEQRLKNYSKLYGFKVEITTLSNEATGTTITINLPLKYKV